MNPEQVLELSALANGIIPADERDRGAGEVRAGERLAEKVEYGAGARVYQEGLAHARTLCAELYGRGIAQLSPDEVHEMLAALKDRVPAFFKQLRMDVCALYLSDPAVWQRIGFPGPSNASGGYEDFDQPQVEKITRLKEIQQ